MHFSSIINDKFLAILLSPCISWHQKLNHIAQIFELLWPMFVAKTSTSVCPKNYVRLPRKLWLRSNDNSTAEGLRWIWVSRYSNGLFRGFPLSVLAHIQTTCRIFYFRATSSIFSLFWAPLGLVTKYYIWILRGFFGLLGLIFWPHARFWIL